MKTHYEIHHTLRSNFGGLEEKLAERGIKLLRFQNLTKDGHIIDDVMTSVGGKTDGNDGDMLSHANILKQQLEKDLKVHIIRTKIEIEPWSRLAQVAIGNQYYESHFRIAGGPGTASLQKMGCMISINKKKLHTMATLRTRRTYSHHLDLLDAALHGMHTWQIPCAVIGEIETEFAIYDDNPSHDAKWEGLEYAS